jgi:hypothetical protein
MQEYQGPLPPPAQDYKNGFGVTALVVGILAVIFAAIPLTFWLGFILAVIAIPFGFLGRNRAKKGQADNKSTATAGAVLGIIAACLSTLWVVLIVAGVIFTGSSANSDYLDCLDRTPVDSWSICDSYVNSN